MAQIYTCKLTRTDQSTPWGFRLQGGKDFGTPLLIQKVNAGSIAEKVGLRVGDAIIRVNNTDVSEQRHKDAQETIIRAGNNFELGVQRGGFNTWKPTVTPVGTVPRPNTHDSISPITVTRTSLTATNQSGQSARIPSGFNSRMKAFSPCNGVENENASVVRAMVNKQYNSPVSMYSDESIAETLSAQAEVLAGGVLGVNFKKNEKSFDTGSSEVFKMVVEAENEPKTPHESDTDRNGVSSPIVAGLRHVSAPQTKSSQSESSASNCNKNMCAECERLIVGVFVRIRDKNLHVECFKCATCGTSLKNVGYYNINDKLYCDIHAKMIAKQNGANYSGSAGTNQSSNSTSNLSSSFIGTIPSPLSSPFKSQQTNTSNVSFQNNVSTNFNGIKSPSLNNQYQSSPQQQQQQQQQQRPGILKTKTGNYSYISTYG